LERGHGHVKALAYLMDLLENVLGVNTPIPLHKEPLALASQVILFF